jgi:hypothetical protein
MFTNAHIACSCRWRGHALSLLFFYLFIFVCLYLWYIAVLNRAREWALLQPWQALRYNRPYISRPCMFGFYSSHFTRLSLGCKNSFNSFSHCAASSFPAPRT